MYADPISSRYGRLNKQVGTSIVVMTFFDPEPALFRVASAIQLALPFVGYPTPLISFSSRMQMVLLLFTTKSVRTESSFLRIRHRRPHFPYSIIPHLPMENGIRMIPSL